MKHTSLPHLKSILSPVIHSIIVNNKSCEIDPTKFEKHDEPNQNWKNLLTYANQIVNSIFEGEEYIPM